MLEWCTTDEYLEERDSKRPDVRLASVVVMTTSTFRRKILKLPGKLRSSTSRCVTTHLRRAISKVAPECLRGTEVIFLCESEINQHGDIFIRQQNVRWPVEKVNATEHPQ